MADMTLLALLERKPTQNELEAFADKMGITDEMAANLAAQQGVDVADAVDFVTKAITQYDPTGDKLRYGTYIIRQMENYPALYQDRDFAGAFTKALHKFHKLKLIDQKLTGPKSNLNTYNAQELIDFIEEEYPSEEVTIDAEGWNNAVAKAKELGVNILYSEAPWLVGELTEDTDVATLLGDSDWCLKSKETLVNQYIPKGRNIAVWGSDLGVENRVPSEALLGLYHLYGLSPGKDGGHYVNASNRTRSPEQIFEELREANEDASPIIELLKTIIEEEQDMERETSESVKVSEEVEMELFPDRDDVKKAVLDEIKDSKVYKVWYLKDDTDYSIEAEVGFGSQAIGKFHELQLKLRKSTTTDLPKCVINDATTIHEMINKAVSACLIDDGEITEEGYKKFIDPLAGMVNGICVAICSGEALDKREITDLLANEHLISKAFHKQLRELVESSKTKGMKTMVALGKALSSFNTHLFIMAEKDNFLNTNMSKQLLEMQQSLLQKLAKGRTDCSEELKVIRNWNLTEGGK